jgi:aryl-alcohol dehydrogenase-like predicted oxidoreductase
VIEKAIDGSLKRLQTDNVDLYYAHVDRTVQPAETLEAFNNLVEAGKVRQIGCSNRRA